MADSKDEDFCRDKGELDMSESSHVSCNTEDSLDELGSTTPRSDCDTLDSSFQGSRFKQFRQSILANEDNLKRFLETSDEDTRDNVLVLKKLNYVADKVREILLFVKSVKGIAESVDSEMKKEDENLVEVKNYWDDKWSKASAAYRSMHNTITGMKDATTKIDEFVNVGILNFEQRLSKHVIENGITEQALDKQYAEICKLHDELREVADRMKNTEELQKSLLSLNSVISVQMEESIKCQRDIKSTLYLMKKWSETLNNQQHYLPIRSCPTSPHAPHKRNVAIVPLNNSFHHVSPSHPRVDENCFGDIRFINKRKLSSQDRRFQKPFSGKLLKESTPPFVVKLEPGEKDTEVTIKYSTDGNNGRKGDLFDDILKACKPKMDKSQISCKEDKEVLLLASKDSKTEFKQAKIKMESSVLVSEPTVININTKANASPLSNTVNNSIYPAYKQAKPKTINFKEYKKCPNAMYICDDKSTPTAIAPFPASSTGKKPLGQQKKDHENKEQHSKKNSSISTPAPDVYEIDDDDDEIIFIENVIRKMPTHQKNVTVSKVNALPEGNVTAIQQKSRAASTGKRYINNEQPNPKDNSNGKVISQGVAPSSISKVSLVQEKGGRRGRKQNLKKTASKAVSVNDNDVIPAKIPCNVPLQLHQNVVMPGECATVPKPHSHPSISGEKGPYQFRTKGPLSKRIKIESSNKL